MAETRRDSLILSAFQVGQLYEEYNHCMTVISWCKTAALTPGHELEDPQLRTIRQARQEAWGCD